MHVPVKIHFHKKITPCSIVLTIVGAVIIVALTKLYSILNKTRYVISYREESTRNISCHYSREGDALLSAENISVSPKVRTIFFHETSCRGGLNSRQACAVESAARTHPNWQVHVLFSSPITKYILTNTILARLKEFQNVHFARIYIAEYSNGIFRSALFERLKRSPYSISHTSDLLRVVTLRRWGGVYLDMDFVVAKSLDNLPLNWVAKQAGDELAFGVLALAKDDVGINITDDLIDEFAATYDPNDMTNNGPGVISRVINKRCPESIAPAGGHCNDFYIFDPELFYPVYYPDARKYFDAGDLDVIDNAADPYTHHVWNGLTWNLKVDRNSPYAALAEKYCPNVYEVYGDRFGE